MCDALLPIFITLLLLVVCEMCYIKFSMCVNYSNEYYYCCYGTSDNTRYYIIYIHS